MTQRINLGDRVKDYISGFAGIAIARTTWLNGCERITIQAETLDKDGKPYQTETFDEAQIEVIDAGAKALKNYNAPRSPGGPDRHEDTVLRRVEPTR